MTSDSAEKSLHAGREADDVANMVEARGEPPFEPADQRVGFAAMERQRADDARRGAHDGARHVRRHALAPRDLEIGRDIVAIARIVARVDDLEIDAGMDGQAEALDAVADHLRPADQDRLGEALLQHHLRRPQHPLVLALGIDHALHRRARLGEQRLHDEAGAEDEAVELVGIGVEIGDRPARDAALHRRARDRRRDAQHQPRIERARDQRGLAEQRRLRRHRPGRRLRRASRAPAPRSPRPPPSSSPR